MKKTTITLGDTVLDVGPLTIGHMRAIGIGAAKMRSPSPDAAAAEGEFYDAAVEIIAAGTGLPATDILAIPGVDLTQVVVAQRSILELSGLVQSGEAAAEGK